MLVAMLAGTQGIVESSNQRHTEDVTRARVHAAHVVVGADGAPLPAGTAAAVARLDGVDAVTAVVPTEVYPLAAGLGDQSPWAAAGLERHRDGGARSTRDVVRGSLGDVRGDAVAVSRVFADGGDLRVGDTVPVRMADTTPRHAARGRDLRPRGGARRRAARSGRRPAPRGGPGRHGAVRRRRRGRRRGRSRATRPGTRACGR